MNRRSFLRVAASAGALLAGGSVAASTRESARSKLLVIFLSGGPSAKETFNPDAPSAPAEFRGPLSSIPTRIAGVHFSELFPLAAGLNDKFSLIRSLDAGTSDHMPGMENAMLSGRSTVQEIVGNRAADGAPPYVLLNPGSTWPALNTAFARGRAFAPVWNPGTGVFSPPEMATMPEQRLRDRRQLLESLEKLSAPATDAVGTRIDGFRTAALDLLCGGGAFMDALEVDDFDHMRFGQTRLGDMAAIGMQLLDNGAGAVVCYDEPHDDSARWDTHTDAERKMKAMSPELDTVIAELIADIVDARRDITLCVMGEFNRTPRMNGSAGRDHWQHANWALLAGHGIRPGIVVGKSNPRGDITEDRYMQKPAIGNTLIAAAGGTLLPTDQRARPVLLG